MSKYSDELSYGFTSTLAPPVRETRIGVCSAFCGSCSQLRGDVKSGCAQMQRRKFDQSGGCQLNLACGIVSSLTNVVMITHSPLGCNSRYVGMGGMRRTMRASKGKKDEEFIWLHTNMGELDVVQGGIDKLRRAVLYAEKQYHPEAIIIANGCVPGIIGDDIDSLCSELADQVSAKLVPIHCEGFKSRYVASGYDSAYHGVLRFLIDPHERYDKALNRASGARDEGEERDRFKQSRTVNLFNVGSNSNGDEVELCRLVRALGLNPRFLPLHASLDDLKHIGEAALNVSVCATHDDYLLGHLKERFGTPYIIDTLPIGVKNTGIWLRKIAEYFHLEYEAERLIAIEKAQLEEALAPIKERLKGKSVFVGGGETRILTTAEFFHSLGMKLLGVKAHNVDRFVEDILENVTDGELLIEVAAGMPAEELNILSKLKPDLYCGHVGANGWVTRLGIPTIPLFGQAFNFMGYSGAFELARKADKALQNINFARNISRNVELPLSEAWLASDVNDNIKERESA
ncbi:MAG: nitrogenase [Oscillospiraceae bacterium]|jgi:nitrogenase molybdenum-iron protein alpha chain|nr:nitrogenase [Oscillospiraceae bacterium]